MSKHRLWTAVCVLVVSQSLPRAASAGIIEIIAEMSGPQMIGFLVECRLPINTTGGWDSCKTPIPLPRAIDTPKRIWLTLGGGVYVSTGKNVDGTEYRAGRVVMLAFDPMIEIQTVVTETKFELYHGILGATYNFLAGSGFEKFANVGFKLRPVGVVFPITKRYGFDVSYDLRLYPSGYTAEDFGQTSTTPQETKAEVVHGFSFGIRTYF